MASDERTLTLDPSIPPTAAQLDEIAKADPRFHSIFALGGRTGFLGGVVDAEPTLAFPLPSAPAIFLSLSYRAHRSSEKAFRLARFGDYKVTLNDDGANEAAFDFFETRVQHAIFAFTALEAYANECIPDPFTWTTKKSRKGAPDEEVTYDREGTERFVSLPEKLDAILPNVFSVASIKGRVQWERFQNLKRLRDRLIHVKALDSKTPLDPGGMPPEKNSVWADLYTGRKTDLSVHAHEIVMHYGGGNRTWAKKFPYSTLAEQSEEAIQRRLRNEEKRTRATRRGR